MANNKDAIRNAYIEDDPLLTFLPPTTKPQVPQMETTSETGDENVDKNVDSITGNKHDTPTTEDNITDVAISKRTKPIQTQNKRNNRTIRKYSSNEIDTFDDEDEPEISESERKRRRKVIKKLFEDLDGEDLRKNTKSKDLHILIRPKLHQRLVVITSNNGLSINDYINQALEEVTKQELSKILQDGTVDDVIDELIDF